METNKKDRKIGIITFILSVVFLMSACHLTAQNYCKVRLNLYSESPEMVTISPCNNLIVGDYVTLGILADSLSGGRYGVWIAVYYPKEEEKIMDGYLRFTFKDTTFAFKHKQINKKNKQVFFELDNEVCVYILRNEMFLIEVFNDDKRFVSNGDTPYFKDFLKSLMSTPLVNK